MNDCPTLKYLVLMGPRGHKTFNVPSHVTLLYWADVYKTVTHTHAHPLYLDISRLRFFVTRALQSQLNRLMNIQERRS